MTVYVDDMRARFGRMIMCHMFSPNLDELHAMATRLGLRRWFQNPETMPKVSWPHYDISLSKKAEAIRYGAVAVNKYQMLVMANHILGKEQRHIGMPEIDSALEWLKTQI